MKDGDSFNFGNNVNTTDSPGGKDASRTRLLQAIYEGDVVSSSRFEKGRSLGTAFR